MPASGSSSSLFGLAFPDENNPFLPPLEPIRVTGEDSTSLHESQQPGFKAYSGAVIGANIHDPFCPSLNFDSNEYLYGPSGFPTFQYPIPVPVDLGGANCATTSARTRVYIKMVSPEALDERPIEHRRDMLLKLEISVFAEPFGADLPKYFIKIPNTKPVKRSGSRRGRTVLDLKLEVLGATSGKAMMSACRACSIRESSPSSSVSMVDFVAKEDLINVKQGKASIAFRFLCLPVHHGTVDEEYKLRAKILDCDQVLERHTFPNWLRVVSHLHRRRNTPPAIMSQGIETTTVTGFLFNSADIQDISSLRTDSDSPSGTSARETLCSVRVQSESSSAQNPTVNGPASIPPANEVSEPVDRQGHLGTRPAPVDEHVAEEGPVLSRVVPRRGPVSGGEEIALIVSNLPPTIKLYARFGCNIALTAHLAPGVLFCHLPPAAHPGVVNVILCQAPSTGAESHGESFASFEYESDSTKAVSLLMKLLNGKHLLESMPLIERLLQRDAGSLGLEVEPGPLDSNMSLHSSLPESAFLGILSALKHLPDFSRLLATVNEQGQTLLHLAVHLRYRELVQELVHWGMDPNVRDVNGFTALHAGYLCDDLFVVGFLEAEGAAPFALDETGRSPTEFAASISSANGTTSKKDAEVASLAVRDINRSKEPCRLPDGATPAETQETAFGPAVEKGRPSKILSTVGPGGTTQTIPRAIDEQLIHVKPGQAQPLRPRAENPPLPVPGSIGEGRFNLKDLFSAPKLSRRGSTSSKKSGKPESVRKASFTASESNFSEKYGVCGKLAIGRGATSVIRLVHKWNRTEEKVYAVKEFRRRRKSETEREYVKKVTSEFCIASVLHHPNVVETVDLLQDENHAWCEVMEFCSGGDLYGAIRKGGMSAAEVECCFKQLLTGLGYLHRQGVAHRDIKPENLFFDFQGRLKIGDFGASTVYRLPWESIIHKSSGLCGSELYIAPEEFAQSSSYDARLVDAWACGIVYYCMHFQEIPWGVSQPSDSLYSTYATQCASAQHSITNMPLPAAPTQPLSERMRQKEKEKEKATLYPTAIQNLSPRACRPILRRMLEPNPDHRVLVEDILENPWIISIEMCTDPSVQPKHTHHCAMQTAQRTLPQ